MSQLLNETNEIWNETFSSGLQNSSKKMKYQQQTSKSSNNNRRQSIKLQIELPIRESNENFKLRKSSTFCDTKQTELEINDDSDDDQYNPTIRLQISFDTNSRKQPKRINSNSAKKQTDKASLVTSGYSSSLCSSNSSMINYVHDLKDKSFYLDETNQFQAHINDKYSEENIYDKLNYNVSSYKRRSLASTNSSMSSNSSSVNSSFTRINKPDHKVYYEEISNFSQLEQKPRIYENEMIKPAVSIVKKTQPVITNPIRQTLTNYRREYTVNEIFQNLKSFKHEAQQQEELNGNYLDIKDIKQQPKSVSFLKQIFETKKTKSSTKPSQCLLADNLATRIQSKELVKQSINEETKQHIYVNDKISRLLNI